MWADMKSVFYTSGFYALKALAFRAFLVAEDTSVLYTFCFLSQNCTLFFVVKDS